jgi:hypothetical protein
VTPAFADDEVPNHNVPKMEIIPHCDLKQVGNEMLCTYSLEKWKLVLKADVELVSKRKLLAKEKERSAALTLQVDGLKSQVGVYANSQKLLVERNNKLTQDLIDLDKKYQNERVKPRWGSPLAWTVAAVSTSVLAGFILKDVFD